MKNRSLGAIALAVALFFSQSFTFLEEPPVDGSNKLALIIAIGDYNRGQTGWSKINSDRDIPLVKGALTRIGFQDGNISILQDQDATHDGILKALAALRDKAKLGDMIVIHVSSHGQQITDNNHEEADGYDETIIAYGAPSKDSYFRKTRGEGAGDYDGSLHLRDEEFGNAINQIRAKVGENGHVLVTMDSCHSGSGTRGSAEPRGGEAPYDLSGVPPDATAVKDEGGFGIEVDKNAKLGKFVLISGASAAEVNYEARDDNGEGVGSLSYCLSKALPTLEAGATYQTLFARIASEMADKAPNQTPQLEGDVDYQVFGNKYTPKPKFFKVSSIKDARHLKLDAGLLMNATPGTLVKVKNSTEGKELAKGKITAARNFDADIELDTDITEKKNVNLEVYVTSQAVPDKKVSVSLDSVTSAPLKAGLIKSLTAMGMVEIAKDKDKKKSDLNVSDAGSKGNFTVNINTTAYGSRLMKKPINTADLEKAITDCTNLIQNYAQGNLFKGLDMSDESFKVVIRVLPLRADFPPNTNAQEKDTVDSKNFLDKGNMIGIPDGTRIVIWAKNMGTRKAYFNVIDLEPNGKINPVLPPIDRKNNRLYADLQPNYFVLEPGEKRVFTSCVIPVSPPYGNEIFKVFATGAPFDLSSTINTKGAEVGTRGAGPNPLEKLMGKSFEKGASTRGAGDAEINVEEMGTNTFEYSFRIVKKK